MIIRTILNNYYQTSIPKKIREVLEVKNASYVEWDLDVNNKISTVQFVKKPSLLEISKLNRRREENDNRLYDRQHFHEALFNEDHQYHKHALSLINVLDQNQLYITTIELIKVRDLCKNLDKETKMEMFRLVTEITKSAECS